MKRTEAEMTKCSDQIRSDQITEASAFELTVDRFWWTMATVGSADPDDNRSTKVSWKVVRTVAEMVEV
jgi:hypothetical protein